MKKLTSGFLAAFLVCSSSSVPCAALLFSAPALWAIVSCSPQNPDDPTVDDDDDDDPEGDDPTGGNGSSVVVDPSSGTGESGTVTPPPAHDEDDNPDDVLNTADFPKSVSVVWNGTTAVVEGAKDVVSCSIEGGDVVIGSKDVSVEGLNLVLSGTSSDGSIKIYGSKKVLITLNGLMLSSKTGPAINNQCKKRLFIQLPAGKASSLADASEYSGIPSDEDAKACLFSEGQIVFAGEGSLEVKGNSKHAIASDDYVRVCGGSLKISGSKVDGIHVNEYFVMDGGSLSVTSTSEGIDCDEGYVSVTGGSVNVTTTGVKAHGIKAYSDIIISGGTVSVSVSGAGSKALKADNDIFIEGGELELKTTGTSFYDTDEKDTVSPCCIKADGGVVFTDGSAVLSSSGLGGKCVNCYVFEMNGGSLSASTSGNVYSYNRMYCRPKAVKAMSGITVNGGKLDVLTTRTEGEGVESKGVIIVNGGEVHVKAYDDAINSGSTYTQNGGYVFCWSTNNDGLDSNYGKKGAVTVNGGVLMAHGASSPEMGIDADNNSYLVFNQGATVFTTGGNQGGGMGGSGSSPSVGQPALALSGYSFTANRFTLAGSDGSVIMSCQVPRSVSSGVSFITSPSLKSGVSYKYGMLSSAPSAPAYSWDPYFFAGGTVDDSGLKSLSGTYKAESGLTSSGSSSSGGGFPGGGGGFPGGRP